MTHDRGSEMSTHCSITEATGVEVFFTDAHSPWQKPLVERLNRELPRWLPRRLDLGQFSQAELDSLAARINTLPRKSMGWMTPAERFVEPDLQDLETPPAGSGSILSKSALIPAVGSNDTGDSQNRQTMILWLRHQIWEELCILGSRYPKNCPRRSSGLGRGIVGMGELRHVLMR